MTEAPFSTSTSSDQDGQDDVLRVLEPGVEYVQVVPAGGSLARFDTDDRLGYPRRKTGDVQLLDLPSFVVYVVMHKTDGTSIYLDHETGLTVAVLNDHSVERPGWGDHRASFWLTGDVEQSVLTIQRETGLPVFHGHPREVR